jgi:lipopolysaccharide/colanic/teichoic acid biosynthesis glycosyltransferase
VDVATLNDFWPRKGPKPWRQCRNPRKEAGGGGKVALFNDLYYIYNRNFDLDLSILFETIFVVLKKKGAH